MSEPNRRETHMATQDFIAYYAGELDSTGDDLYATNIDIVHHQIHAGNHFTRSLPGTIDAGTANALAISIQPGLATRIHLSAEITADKAGFWELYEQPTIATYSGTVIPFNNNRNSANLSAGTFRIPSGIAALGTLLQGPRYIGASQGISRVGGGDSTRHEWMLNPSYEYLLWYVADNATTRASVEIQFYEVDA